MNRCSPLVSFCVPAYGRAGFLGATLRSALEQTVADFEIVVVNDNSPDDTERVVESFSDPRILYTRNRQTLGVPENLNRAMAIGKGKYLVLLEDHDLLAPNYLEETLRIAEQHREVGFVATGLREIDEEGQPLRTLVQALPEVLPGKRLLRTLLTHVDCPFTVTTLIRRAALQGIDPPFDSRYWWFADLNLWMKLSARTNFGYVAKPLLQMRIREKDHYLSGREWQIWSAIDRLHRDNWNLLHSRASLGAFFDRLRYEVSRIPRIARFSAGRRAGRKWGREDVRAARACLSLPLHLVIRAMCTIPPPVLELLRQGFQSTRARNDGGQAARGNRGSH